jgi:hypothetical protein
MKAVPKPPPAIKIWRDVCWGEVAASAIRTRGLVHRPKPATTEDVRKSLLFIISPFNVIYIFI